jgi:hypothetical protein
MKTKPAAPTNVRLSSKLGGKLSLVCEYDGARYHVWVDPATLAHDGDLYKNPPLGTPTHSPDYFRTRTLDAKAKANARLIDAMLAIAKQEDALGKFHTRWAQTKQEQDAAQARRNSEQRVRDSAPELLEALQEMNRLAKGPAGGVDVAAKRAAIALADAAIAKAVKE